MPSHPLTVPAHALPAVGSMLGHSASRPGRRRHPRRNTSPPRPSRSLAQRDQQRPVTSQALAGSARRDPSNDNPMESGFPGGAPEGARTLPRHGATSRLLAPTGLSWRLSLLKVGAKVYAHVPSDTDLRKRKDIFLSVERFSRGFELGQSGTAVTSNTLGFGTLLLEGKPSLRTADPRNLLFSLLK